MKKFILLLPIILFLSCTTDEEANNQASLYKLEDFIGSWSYDSLEINGKFLKYQHKEGCYKDLFVFYGQDAGNTLQFEEQIRLFVDCGVSQTFLEWKLIDDKIKLYSGEQLILIYNVLTVTSDSLKLSFNADIDEDGEIDKVEVNASSYDPYDMFN